MKQYYKIAGLHIAISIEDGLWIGEERTLAPFLKQDGPTDHCYYFEMVDRLEEPIGDLVTWADNAQIFSHHQHQLRYIGATSQDWEKAYVRVCHSGCEHYVQLLRSQYLEKIGTKTILTGIGFEHLIAQNNGFILHCSYIVHNGKALLFTAPSETGKSTQAELWKEFRGARIINGDRAAVRIVDGVPMAEGIPFAGSSQYCLNESHPIAAVVCLGQAKQTTIHPMRGREAFSRIWEGITLNVWDRDDVEKVSDCLMKLITSVPVYRLECTPDESAVKALEAML